MRGVERLGGCAWLGVCDEVGWGGRCGGPTHVVFKGGCPGRALGRMGTLVVRMMGSSLLVEEELDCGGAEVCGLVGEVSDLVCRCSKISSFVSITTEGLRSQSGDSGSMDGR